MLADAESRAQFLILTHKLQTRLVNLEKSPQAAKTRHFAKFAMFRIFFFATEAIISKNTQDP